MYCHANVMPYATLCLWESSTQSHWATLLLDLSTIIGISSLYLWTILRSKVLELWKGNLVLLQTSRPPTPSPTDMDSSSDSNVIAHAGARWATESCYPMLHWLLPYVFPCASINRAPDTTATEADPMLPQIPIPVSAPVINTSSEPPSMVSIVFISLTAMTNYYSLRMCHFQLRIPNVLSDSMLPEMYTCTSRRSLRPLM